MGLNWILNSQSEIRSLQARPLGTRTAKRAPLPAPTLRMAARGCQCQ